MHLKSGALRRGYAPEREPGLAACGGHRRKARGEGEGGGGAGQRVLCTQHLHDKPRGARRRNYRSAV